MKTILRSMLSALAIAAATGCATGTTHVLKPSELNAALHDMDADATNPFAKPASKVEYLEVGLADYDKFFKSTAQVQGTVVVADVLVNQMKTQLQQARDAVVPGGDVIAAGLDMTLHAADSHKLVVDAQRAQVQQALDHAKLTATLLAEIPKRSLELAGTGKNLVTGAPKVFTGLNALKLAAVTSGLNDAIKRLQDAGDRAPKLVTSLHEQTDAAVALLTPGEVPAVAAAAAPAPAPSKGKKKARKTASAATHKPSKS